MKYIFTLLFLLTFLPTANAQLLTESDKHEHFAAGAVLGGVAYGLVLEETESKPTAMAASILTAFVVGYIKESHDAKQGYGFDNRDLLATTYGGLSMGITLDIFARKPKKGRSVINFGFLK
jgi:hypothetical protein